MYKRDGVLKRCFFFNDTATTEIYTLSLHDALPISRRHVLLPLTEKERRRVLDLDHPLPRHLEDPDLVGRDRKSTRLNSSHANISYAVFCLKKKNNTTHRQPPHHACLSSFYTSYRYP